MKKTLSFAPLCLVMTLFLASCGSSLTVQKRQHNRGYHVAFNKNPRGAAKHQETELATEKSIRPEIVQEPAAELPAKGLKEIQELTAIPAERELVAQEAKVTKGSKAATQPVEKSKVRTKRTPLKSMLETPFDQMRETAAKVRELKESVAKDQSANASAARDGLSLFWIVILILLILWALGVIGSWGSFVYILLVVALILLILWLLQVV